MIWSWKVRLLSIFISSSSSEELALIHEFCICIDFVSYGLIKKWLSLELAIKPFSWNHFNTLVTLDPKKFITSEKVCPQTQGVVSSTQLAKSVSLLIKNKSAINIINKMGPKINPCGTPKSIFRKSLNSEPTLVFYFLL